MLRSLIHPLEEIFEVIESALPKPRHLACPVDQRAQGVKLRAVVCLTAFMAVAYQPGLLEYAKMLGNGRLRDSGSGCQSPNRLLSLAAQLLEDRPPGRIGERSEEHTVSVAHF
jgi:hypothetical protein